MVCIQMKGKIPIQLSDGVTECNTFAKLYHLIPCSISERRDIVWGCNANEKQYILLKISIPENPQNSDFFEALLFAI